MAINVGGLWDRPIPVAEEMPSAETLRGYSIEAYQSHGDSICFKSYSPFTHFDLESDPEYSIRGFDVIKEIYRKEQPETRSGKLMDDQNESLFNVGCGDIEKSENILSGNGDGRAGSKALRVRSSSAKDRHTKVNTAKGLRDRRVRLSLSTAVEFYDVQYRLGFDRPGKVLDWLINKAQTAINELPQPDCSTSKTCHRCGRGAKEPSDPRCFSLAKEGMGNENGNGIVSDANDINTISFSPTSSAVERSLQSCCNCAHHLLQSPPS